MFPKPLKKLGIQETNSGAATGGKNGWLKTNGKELVSYSPVDGKPIAIVIMADRTSYETVMEKAEDAFKTFRMMPAPKRGDIVREIGDPLDSKTHLWPNKFSQNGISCPVLPVSVTFGL